MVDFNKTWENIIDISPFSKEIIYKVGRNSKTIKAIISNNKDEYAISQITIEVKNIPLGDNVSFIIDEIEYKIISFEKGLTLKIWIEKV